jgi:hypothetical protein
LRDVLIVEKITAFSAHRSLGSMIENYSKICAILRKVGKVLQFEAAVGFEPSANGGWTICSVAVGRRLGRRDNYLSDWTRKHLSL